MYQASIPITDVQLGFGKQSFPLLDAALARPIPFKKCDVRMLCADHVNRDNTATEHPLC